MNRQRAVLAGVITMSIDKRIATGRAKCKACLERIAKGRVEIVFRGWTTEHYHYGCIKARPIEQDIRQEVKNAIGNKSDIKRLGHPT